VQGPDYSDWLLTLNLETMRASREVMKRLRNIKGPLLCCPEDHECSKDGCVQRKRLCNACSVPLCRVCANDICKGLVPPRALMHNNWQGYLEAWVYEVGLTWMEKTVASPFWTGMTLFCIDVKGSTKRRKHLLNNELHACTGRVQFKGQVFTAPLHPVEILKSLLAMEDGEVVELPVTGEMLKMRCQISITSGLVQLSKLYKPPSAENACCNTSR
jgi:hypothetical protein